jgi:LAO/AO transport system kinase
MVALEAAGYPWVFVETVGAGQADWLIEEWVDTVVVVVSPAVGDDMQIEKAGLLEVADILVVNHGDRTEAENVARLLRERVDGGSGKRPPVVVTESLQGRGIDTLLEELRARGARRDAPRGREAARGEPGAETET